LCVDGNSINWSILEQDISDSHPTYFHYKNNHHKNHNQNHHTYSKEEQDDSGERNQGKKKKKKNRLIDPSLFISCYKTWTNSTTHKIGFGIWDLNFGMKFGGICCEERIIFLFNYFFSFQFL